MIQKYPCYLTLVCIVLLTQNIKAGGGIQIMGARQAGMGRISVAISDFWSCNTNQAGIALFSKAAIGINYESRFGIQALGIKNFGAILPTRFGVFGATVNHYGYSLYKEVKAGLVYARSFGPYIRIGLQLDYLQTILGDDYGSRSIITFELGVQSDITESLTLGAWVFNPIRMKLSEFDDERLISIIRFGLSWHISAHFLASIEAEKNTSIQPISFRAGAEYCFKEKFFVRMGLSNNNELLSMGFGINYRSFRFDIASGMHQYLGYSPQASLLYTF